MSDVPYTALTTVDDFGLRESKLKYNATLSASNDSFTVPSSSPRYKAVFKVESGGSAWVAVNGTAAVPVGATFAATTSELINDTPLCREVKAGDVIDVITAGTSIDASIVFYA